MSDAGEPTEDHPVYPIYNNKQPSPQSAAALDALATHPLTPAPGGNSYLHLPADPPLHTMRARQEGTAIPKRPPGAPGPGSRHMPRPLISSADDRQDA